MSAPVPDRPSPARLEDFPSLQAFGAELATERTARRARRLGVLRALPRGVTFGSVGVAALVVTGSAAAGLTALTGSPIPAPLRADDTVTVWPRDGDSRIAPARAADPEGGPPWAVRIGGADGGLVCAAPGQVRGDVFGIVGRDERFRALPAQVGGGCVTAPTPGHPIVAARAVAGDAVGPAALPTRGTTVLYGVGGDRLRRVVVRPAIGEVLRPRPTADGVFVVALRGLPAAVQPVVDLEWQGGKRRRVDLRQPQTVPDPAGGPWWDVSATDRAQLDARPYGARRTPRRLPPACFTVTARGSGAPWLCGTTAERGAWAIRPASAPRRTEERRAPRWSGPSRTIVVVRVAPEQTPVVTAAGRAWPVRWAGSFGLNHRLDHRDLGWVAVLPASVDPAAVRVRDADRGGRPVAVGRAVLGDAPTYQVIRRGRR